MSLLSAILFLTPTAPYERRGSLGRAAHAWFLDRVLAHDHRLAAALHEPNQERPFTVSDVWRQRAGEGERESVRPSHPPILSPSHTLNLRLTSYAPELTQLLEERILPDLPETLRLGEMAARIEGWTTEETAHPWAGKTSFEALTARHTLQDVLPHRLTLQFASPTVFKSQEQFLPFPLPRLVFEGLVRRWNAFSPLQIHPEATRYAEECMAVGRYRLQTEMVSFGGDEGRGALSGCVGDCTYVLRVKDRYWMGLIHLLAGFAFYAGVGKQTTMGMGRTRAWESERVRG